MTSPQLQLTDLPRTIAALLQAVARGRGNEFLKSRGGALPAGLGRWHRRTAAPRQHPGLGQPQPAGQPARSSRHQLASRKVCAACSVASLPRPALSSLVRIVSRPPASPKHRAENSHPTRRVLLVKVYACRVVVLPPRQRCAFCPISVSCPVWGAMRKAGFQLLSAGSGEQVATAAALFHFFAATALGGGRRDFGDPRRC